MVVLDLCLLSFGSNVNLIACLSTLSAWPSVRLCVSLAASEARAVNDLTAAGLFGPTSGRQRGGERESGQTMVRYLDFLAEELKVRRAKHGLTLSHRALVIGDDASQHSDQRFQELRQLWEDENNCQLQGFRAFRV